VNAGHCADMPTDPTIISATIDSQLRVFNHEGHEEHEAKEDSLCVLRDLRDLRGSNIFMPRL
jgi:hypothetical protein